MIRKIPHWLQRNKRAVAHWFRHEFKGCWFGMIGVIGAKLILCVEQ